MSLARQLVGRRLASRLAAGLALSPALLVAVVVYVGCTAWTLKPT